MSPPRLLLLSALLLLPPAATPAAGPGPIGVLGDSYSDEYRFYPPDRTRALNWVEILAAARGLDFGPYSLSSRGEPRNAGFAYNWARSGATTVSLVASGQHTGLAEQVRRGEVRLVVLFIGGNDFINALHAADPDAALRATLPRALSYYRIAFDAIRAASRDVPIVVATLPDVRNLPEFAGPIRDGRLPRETVDACSAAMRRFNAQVRAIAAQDPRVALLDLYLVTRMSNLVSREYVLVAGHRLDRQHPSNDLDHFFLADVRHPGTLGQALMARLFVDAINAKFGAGVAPLGDPDILAVATQAAAPVLARDANRSDADVQLAGGGR